MLFVLDAGNTEIVLGIFRHEDLVSTWRISSSRERTGDEYGSMFSHMLTTAGVDLHEISGAIMSSSVPSLNQELFYGIQRYIGVEVLMVGPGVKTGMDIRYDNPKDVSPDRIANAVGAFKKYSGPSIIVDFGTGTTFDVVSKEGTYIGGAIAPGIFTSSQMLFQSAARLPDVQIKEPESSIGRNVADSIQSGIVFGFAGLCDGLVMRMMKDTGPKTTVVATGPAARMIASISQTIQHVEPYLTLLGLRSIYKGQSR